MGDDGDEFGRTEESKVGSRGAGHAELVPFMTVILRRVSYQEYFVADEARSLHESFRGA